jgi:hypothetical protein
MRDQRTARTRSFNALSARSAADHVRLKNRLERQQRGLELESRPWTDARSAPTNLCPFDRTARQDLPVSSRPLSCLTPMRRHCRLPATPPRFPEPDLRLPSGTWRHDRTCWGQSGRAGVWRSCLLVASSKPQSDACWIHELGKPLPWHHDSTPVRDFEAPVGQRGKSACSARIFRPPFIRTVGRQTAW